MNKENKLTLALWIIPAIVLTIIVLFLPAQIPLHFNYKGQADWHGSRYWIYVLIPIPYLVYITRIKKKKK